MTATDASPDLYPDVAGEDWLEFTDQGRLARRPQPYASLGAAPDASWYVPGEGMVA